MPLRRLLLPTLALVLACGPAADREAEPVAPQPEAEAPPPPRPAELETAPEAEREPAREAAHPDERIAEIEALAELGDRAAIPRIRESLRDEDPEVRETAIELLEELGGEEAIDALGEFLLKETNPELKLDAIDVLESLGGERAAAALLRALEDPDPEIRQELVIGIAILDERSAVAPLREAHRRERDADVREDMLDTLELLGEDVEALRE